MKKSCVFFNFSITVSCPECGREIDLEEDDYRQNWIRYFKAWLNNERDTVDSVSEKEQCPHCGMDFLINEISR